MDVVKAEQVSEGKLWYEHVEVMNPKLLDSKKKRDLCTGRVLSDDH